MYFCIWEHSEKSLERKVRMKSEFTQFHNSNSSVGWYNMENKSCNVNDILAKGNCINDFFQIIQKPVGIA